MFDDYKINNDNNEIPNPVRYPWDSLKSVGSYFEVAIPEDPDLRVRARARLSSAASVRNRRGKGRFSVRVVDNVIRVFRVE